MNTELWVLVTVLVVTASAIYQLICASVLATIASSKNHNRFVFFILTLLMLGPLGIAVAVRVPPAEQPET